MDTYLGVGACLGYCCVIHVVRVTAGTWLVVVTLRQHSYNDIAMASLWLLTYQMDYNKEAALFVLIKI